MMEQYAQRSIADTSDAVATPASYFAVFLKKIHSQGAKTPSQLQPGCSKNAAFAVKQPLRHSDFSVHGMFS